LNNCVSARVCRGGGADGVRGAAERGGAERGHPVMHLLRPTTRAATPNGVAALVMPDAGSRIWSSGAHPVHTAVETSGNNGN
jgi:hypothetical protein